MTVCIVTGSTQRDWVRPLSSLARRGVGAIAVLVDLDSFAAADSARPNSGLRELSAVRHALSEYGLAHVVLRAGDDPARVLVTRERVRA
jgi:hypothetical protein